MNKTMLDLLEIKTTRLVDDIIQAAENNDGELVERLLGYVNPYSITEEEKVRWKNWAKEILRKMIDEA